MGRYWKVGLVLALVAAAYFAFVAMTPTHLAAQQVVSYGLKAGPTSSSMSLDQNLDHQGSRTGFVLGGFAVVELPDIAPLRLQPELQYVQKGMRWEDSDFGEHYRLNLSYLEMALLARHDLDRAESKYQPFFVAGPALALRVGATTYWDDLESDAGEDFDSKDLGFIIGAGVQRGAISLEARGSLGLLNVSTDEDIEAKNRALTLVVGYTVP
jgi:hypothetical protein